MYEGELGGSMLSGKSYTLCIIDGMNIASIFVIAAMVFVRSCQESDIHPSSRLSAQEEQICQAS